MEFFLKPWQIQQQTHSCTLIQRTCSFGYFQLPDIVAVVKIECIQLLLLLLILAWSSDLCSLCACWLCATKRPVECGKSSCCWFLLQLSAFQFYVYNKRAFVVQIFSSFLFNFCLQKHAKELPQEKSNNILNKYKPVNKINAKTTAAAAAVKKNRSCYSCLNKPKTTKTTIIIKSEKKQTTTKLITISQLSSSQCNFMPANEGAKKIPKN